MPPIEHATNNNTTDSGTTNHSGTSHNVTSNGVTNHNGTSNGVTSNGVTSNGVTINGVTINSATMNRNVAKHDTSNSARIAMGNSVLTRDVVIRCVKTEEAANNRAVTNKTGNRKINSVAGKCCSVFVLLPIPPL